MASFPIRLFLSLPFPLPMFSFLHWFLNRRWARALEKKGEGELPILGPVRFPGFAFKIMLPSKSVLCVFGNFPLRRIVFLHFHGLVVVVVVWRDQWKFLLLSCSPSVTYCSGRREKKGQSKGRFRRSHPALMVPAWDPLTLRFIARRIYLLG